MSDEMRFQCAADRGDHLEAIFYSASMWLDVFQGNRGATVKLTPEAALRLADAIIARYRPAAEHAKLVGVTMRWPGPTAGAPRSAPGPRRERTVAANPEELALAGAIGRAIDAQIDRRHLRMTGAGGGGDTSIIDLEGTLDLVALARSLRWHAGPGRPSATFWLGGTDA